MVTASSIQDMRVLCKRADKCVWYFLISALFTEKSWAGNGSCWSGYPYLCGDRRQTDFARLTHSEREAEWIAA